jgi:acyl carrier protein
LIYTAENKNMAANYDEVLMRLSKQLTIIAGAEIIFDSSTELVEGLGLDSFKVLDLLLEVEDEFDISVPMNVLTEIRTVEDMARRIYELEPAAE